MEESKQEYALIEAPSTNQNNAASPTAKTEPYPMTAVFDSKKKKNIMTGDIPNTFVQTEIENKSNGKKVITKIRRQLVNMSINISPETHQVFVREEEDQKIL